jgi:hypothetical protein
MIHFSYYNEYNYFSVNIIISYFSIIVATTWSELTDGSLLIVSRSVPDMLACQSGYVRGSVVISGFLIQPQNKDNLDPIRSNDFIKAKDKSMESMESKSREFHSINAEESNQELMCKVTLCAHTELGGTLPASVINMLSTSAPLKMLSAIREIVTN